MVSCAFPSRKGGGENGETHTAAARRRPVQARQPARADRARRFRRPFPPLSLSLRALSPRLPTAPARRKPVACSRLPNSRPAAQPVDEERRRQPVKKTARDHPQRSVAAAEHGAMPRLAGKKRVAEQLAELANPAPLDSEFRVARDDGLAAGSDSGHSESDNDEDWAAATSRSGPVGRNTNQQEPGFNEELKQMELAEQAIIQNMSRSAQSEIEKGRHVRTQLSLWDVLLDTRIRLQKVVSAANRLPPFGLLPAFLQKEESAAAVAGAKDELRGLFDCLRSLQEELVERNETLGFEGQRKRKRDENHNKIEGYLEGVWSDLQAFHEEYVLRTPVPFPLESRFLAFRNDTLEKWSAKMMLASSTSGGTAKKLKVLDQSAVTQISH
ncbi:MAG: apoptosis antagonizing transcription factor-domain-containing protein, partial [Olpidium bornovanus]